MVGQHASRLTILASSAPFVILGPCQFLLPDLSTDSVVLSVRLAYFSLLLQTKRNMRPILPITVAEPYGLSFFGILPVLYSHSVPGSGRPFAL